MGERRSMRSLVALIPDPDSADHVTNVAAAVAEPSGPLTVTVSLRIAWKDAAYLAVAPTLEPGFYDKQVLAEIGRACVEMFSERVEGEQP